MRHNIDVIYSRYKGAYGLPWCQQAKYKPSVDVFYSSK